MLHSGQAAWETENPEWELRKSGNVRQPQALKHGEIDSFTAFEYTVNTHSYHELRVAS